MSQTYRSPLVRKRAHLPRRFEVPWRRWPYRTTPPKCVARQFVFEVFRRAFCLRVMRERA